jgi:hypothetical protein
MNRRNFLGLVGAGAAAGDLVSQAIAQRTESAAVPAAQRTPFAPIRPASVRTFFLITLDMVTPDHYHPTRTLHCELNLPVLRGLFQDSVVVLPASGTPDCCKMVANFT